MTFRSLWGFLALSHMFQLGEGKEGDALEMHFFRLASKNKDLYSYLQDLLLHCFQRPKLCIISNFSLLFFACHYKSSSRVWKVVKVHYLSCQTYQKYSRCREVVMVQRLRGQDLLFGGAEPLDFAPSSNKISDNYNYLTYMDVRRPVYCIPAFFQTNNVR